MSRVPSDPLIAGEILTQSMQSLEHSTYLVIIISASNKVMKEALAVIGQISIRIDISNNDEMLALIKTSIGTKFVVR